MDVSVVLPVINERDNLRVLIPRLHAVLGRDNLTHEIIVVHGNSADGTPETARELGARVVPERRRGYAGALMTGFAEARADYILTLDADLSHEPDFVARMWRARTRGDIVIASRYVPGGVTYNSFVRDKLSAILNFTLRRMLAMPVGDLSSGFRLYRRAALDDIAIEARNFEVLEEVLAKAYTRGFSIVEIPFTYFPREAGRSHARVIRFGIDLLRATLKLRRLRNSPDAADWGERAFYSRIPPVRRRQRRRHQATLSWARGAERVLAVGCGSTVIVESLSNAIAMDSVPDRLRYMRRCGMPLVRGSARAIPFRDGAFDCVIGSQVLGPDPEDDFAFAEIARVLKRDGTLVVPAADDSRARWRLVVPLGRLLTPAAERMRCEASHTPATFGQRLDRYGFTVEDTACVAKGEMLLRCRKRPADRGSAAAGAGLIEAPGAA
jgi:dolichol-phosphate mannosyltransferase